MAQPIKEFLQKQQTALPVVNTSQMTLKKVFRSKWVIALALFLLTFFVLLWIRPPLIKQTRKKEYHQRKNSIRKLLFWSAVPAIIVIICGMLKRK